MEVGSIPAAVAQAQLIAKIQRDMAGESGGINNPNAARAERERLEAIGAMSRQAIESIAEAASRKLLDVRA